MNDKEPIEISTSLHLDKWTKEQFDSCRRKMQVDRGEDLTNSDALLLLIQMYEKEREEGERRMSSAEQSPTAKEDRLEAIVTELLVRLEQGSDEPEISTTEIYELLGGQVSKTTCSTYVDELAIRPGFDKTDQQPGGWGGGCEAKRLRMDVKTFVEKDSIEQLRFVDATWFDRVEEPEVIYSTSEKKPTE